MIITYKIHDQFAWLAKHIFKTSHEYFVMRFQLDKLTFQGFTKEEEECAL